MIHENLSRLMSLSMGVLISLVGLGSALQLEKISVESIAYVSTIYEKPQMIRTGINSSDQLFQGHEVVAILSHHLREEDIQMVNAGIVYVDSHQEDLKYSVDGTIVETWDQLDDIPFDGHYSIAYNSQINSRTTAIAFQSVAGD